MSALSRYSRQIVLREVGVNGQQILRDSSALVVGLGGLGSVAALYLAGAGLGRLRLCDRDRVEASNLHRQILYTQTDLGRPKTDAACERLAALNPQVELQALSPEGLESAVRDSDVVLDCTDNFASRYALNRLCVQARTPLISGAAIRFEGQVGVFDLRRADAACYACLFPDTGGDEDRCEDAGILGPVAGVVGSAQALAALQLLLGVDDNNGKLRLWNAHAMEWKTLNLKRDPHCDLHHD